MSVANAAQLTLEWLDRYWPMMPVGIEFFAVGQQTAEILAGADITALSPMGRQNSEALLALPELQGLSDQRVIIFRGLWRSRNPRGDAYEARRSS